MKQVNPRFINVIREFKYVTLDSGCDDFKDLYTKAEYAKTGCFGCENLDGGYYYKPSCKLKHQITFKYIKKTEENTIASGCNTCTPKFSQGGYASNFCDNCRSYYRGGGMGKCRMRNVIRKEVFRYG